MSRYPRILRSAVLFAAVLHALVGGWGPWLHGTPALAHAVVHASEAPGAVDVSGHTGDCALCHSASLHQAPGPRHDLWAGSAEPGVRVASAHASTRSAGPVQGHGARAPPRSA